MSLYSPISPLSFAFPQEYGQGWDSRHQKSQVSHANPRISADSEEEASHHSRGDRSDFHLDLEQQNVDGVDSLDEEGENQARKRSKPRRKHCGKEEAFRKQVQQQQQRRRGSSVSALHSSKEQRRRDQRKEESSQSSYASTLTDLTNMGKSKTTKQKELEQKLKNAQINMDFLVEKCKRLEQQEKTVKDENQQLTESFKSQPTLAESEKMKKEVQKITKHVVFAKIKFLKEYDENGQETDRYLVIATKKCYKAIFTNREQQGHPPGYKEKWINTYKGVVRQTLNAKRNDGQNQVRLLRSLSGFAP